MNVFVAEESSFTTWISTRTAAQSDGNGGVSAAMDCPSVLPESDHTGTCTDPFAHVTSEGFPVARTKSVAERWIGAPAKPAADIAAQVRNAIFFIYFFPFTERE